MKDISETLKTSQEVEVEANKLVKELSQNVLASFKNKHLIESAQQFKQLNQIK
jgi:hypothetical protein